MSELLGARRKCRLPRARTRPLTGSSAVDPLAAVSVRESGGPGVGRLLLPGRRGRAADPVFLPRGEAGRRVPGRSVRRHSRACCLWAVAGERGRVCLVTAAGPQPRVRGSEDRLFSWHRSEKSHDWRLAKPLKQRPGCGASHERRVSSHRTVQRWGPRWPKWLSEPRDEAPISSPRDSCGCRHFPAGDKRQRPGSHAGVWAGRIAADRVGPRAGGGQTRGEDAAGGSPPAPASGGFADGEKFVSKSGRGRAAPARPRVSAPGTLAGRLPRQSVAFGRGTRAHASATRHGRTGRWPERGVRVSQEGLPRGVPRPLTCDKTGDTFGFVTQCHGLGSRTEDTRCPTDPGLDAGGHAVRSVAVPPRP